MRAPALLWLGMAGCTLTAAAAPVAQEIETVMQQTAPARPGALSGALSSALPSTSPSALPSADAIRAAIRDTIAERPENPRLHEADTLRSTQYQIFARHVEEGAVPDCLHSDGLKRQPTFFLSGYLALPFIAVAKLRGVCK
jgi:hypothetical protein